MLFGVITAMTSPKSWEAIIAGHEVRYLAHDAWNGLLKESVEKDAFIASEKKKVKKQPGGHQHRIRSCTRSKGYVA